MRRKNEYDEIYLHTGKFGTEYVYKNHRLSGENFIPLKELSKIGAFKCNDDRIVIRCGACGIHMNFAHGLKGVATGKWFCPECGTFVKEAMVNHYIGELKPKFEENDNDYDEYY